MPHASEQPVTHRRPALVVLDVNETLSDLSPLSQAFAEAGLPGHQVEAWFAGVLRDAFALSLLSEVPSFADLAGDALVVRLQAAGAPDPTAGADQVMGRFTSLDPHPDVVTGIRALSAAGCRIITLSNGSAEVARRLLADTAAADLVEACLGVPDTGAWKPTQAAYDHALRVTGVDAPDAMLVAVHPWDLAGAHRVGLRTAWINRGGTRYPARFPAPDLEAASLAELPGLFSR